MTKAKQPDQPLLIKPIDSHTSRLSLLA